MFFAGTLNFIIKYTYYTDTIKWVLKLNSHISFKVKKDEVDR